MLIKVNGVVIDDRGSYQIAKVNFTNEEGRTETRNVVSSKKFIYAVLGKANEGESFEVEQTKNDKGYWEFTSAKKAAAGAASSAGSKSASASPRSTYETPEERAARQVYIIRQSSLSTATSILAVGAKSIKAADVIGLAKELEAYVFGKEKANIEAIESDIIEFDMPTIE
jgi:hypothetical protein